MYSLGIDVSKDDFQVSLQEKSGGIIRIKGSRKFDNTAAGFAGLLAWVEHKSHPDSNIRYVMEATGSYYEDLAHYLHQAGEQVHVVLPNKVKYYSKSLNVKTKNDKVDAGVISQLGLERELPLWQPLNGEFRHLRDLTRELWSLQQEITSNKNQLHAMKHSHDKSPEVFHLKQQQIDFKEAMVETLKGRIKAAVDKDPGLKRSIGNITKVKGLGLITVITVLCETNGFSTFSKIPQVVSYAGLDVVEKQSGKFKGRTKISKKGNCRIRQCLYMPAMTATRWNEDIRKLNTRILERNPTIKRKGIIAGMRKLLILIYTLWKKNQAYDPMYRWENGKTSGNEETKPSLAKKSGSKAPTH